LEARIAALDIREGCMNKTPLRPLVVQADEQDRDGWDDPVKGRIAWRTLFSGDRTLTDGLTAGIAEVEPGGWLGLHRHTPPEIYYVIEGSGVVTLEGTEHAVVAGSAVFIPGNAEHGVRNPGKTPLRFLYAFAADSFSEIEYRFS
jgi:quercetin dioxygenase-like cupin family protein